MFPFTIKEEASFIPLTIRNSNEMRMLVDCPFCGRKSKMRIDFQKNVYHCFPCDTGGGLTTLYAKYYNISNKEAYKEIIERLNLTQPENSHPVKKLIKVEPIQRISETKLDMAYRNLLSELTLEDVHRRQLFQRGLTQLDLDFYSVPHKNLVLGPEYEHIPGCYEKNNQIITNFPETSGFIIPIRSFSGNIVGLQIRLDRPYDGTKYMWFSSSSKPGGTSSGSPIHFVGNQKARHLYIIEGGLKGCIANYLDPEQIESAACVAGVNNIKNLEDFLKETDPYREKKIILCYDMDKFHNHYVMEGEVKLFNMLYQMGYQPGIFNWIEDRKEVADFYHGRSGNLTPIMEENKIIGFSVVSLLAKRCGFEFYENTNLDVFLEMKKQGLSYLNLCLENCGETEFENQVITLFKKLGIGICYKKRIYEKNQKGIDDYLKSKAEACIRNAE